MRPGAARDRARGASRRLRHRRRLSQRGRAAPHGSLEPYGSHHDACRRVEGVFRLGRLFRRLLLVHPVSGELAQRLLHDMMRIRAVEEAIVARYSEQKMRCPVHLSVGQEAPSAAAGAVLRASDLAVSGHRAHAHYLAKGGDLPAMIAVIYGKATGCASGKGGSMHLADERAGFMGSTAIVGGTVPVGVGLAYAAKLRRTGQVTCIFIGDAVAETGVFFEAVNFAVLKKLPVLFVCEN